MRASIHRKGAMIAKARNRTSIFIAALSIIAVGFSAANAAINWAGHSWNVTNGGMAGKYNASASNISVDANGYLHMKITKTGAAFSCAEMFTTDNLGFGTYQWQIDGAVDKLDKNIVLGLYPYGPAAGIGSDGTNEIDIEFARWGNSAWADGNYTVYPNSGSTVGATTFDFSLNGTYSTSRFVWSGTGISFSVLEGFKELGDTSGMIKKWTYAPSSPATNIPQRAMPLGMNLWICSDGCTTDPTAGVEIIVRSFTFVPPGTSGVAERACKATGENTTPVFSSRNGKTVVRIGRPAWREMTARVFDLRGRSLYAAKIPEGAGEVSLPQTPGGVRLAALYSPGSPGGSEVLIQSRLIR
jgi:hypothetical protein